MTPCWHCASLLCPLPVSLNTNTPRALFICFCNYFLHFYLYLVLHIHLTLCVLPFLLSTFYQLITFLETYHHLHLLPSKTYNHVHNFVYLLSTVVYSIYILYDIYTIYRKPNLSYRRECRVLPSREAPQQLTSGC